MIKILAIHGGGIRGIIPAVILAWLEKHAGKPIAETFDLVAGTSTGEILGAALSIGYTTQDIIGMYENEGEQIFPQSVWRKLHTIGGAAEEKYPSNGIEAVLQKYFGTHKLSDAETNLVVPTYDIERRCPVFFKSYKEKFKNVLMWQVARAASAAPTFFEPYKLEMPNGDYFSLIDGGMYANNPAMCGYVEALAEFDTTDYLVVSLGTGSATLPILHEEAQDWGLVGWAPHILDINFDGQSDTADYQLRRLLPLDRFYNFQPMLVGVNEAMDDASPANIRALKLLAENYICDNRAKLEALCDLLAYQI